MKQLLRAFVVSAALAGAALLPSSALAKSCSSSYTHAVIGGAQKCLRAGEFCARADQSQYRRYGFTCNNLVDGEYHLRRA